MQILLYGLWIIACLYAGFVLYPFWWTVLVLGLVGLGLFFLTRPGAMEIGLRERGASYGLLMVVGNVAIAAVPVVISRLLGWVIA